MALEHLRIERQFSQFLRQLKGQLQIVNAWDVGSRQGQILLFCPRDDQARFPYSGVTSGASLLDNISHSHCLTGFFLGDFTTEVSSVEATTKLPQVPARRSLHLWRLHRKVSQDTS